MTEFTLAKSSSEAIKRCCADFYESDWAKLLLGSSFHPGGLNLTARLGELLGLKIDYGPAAITQATQTA